MSYSDVLEELLAELHASRVTLREDVEGPSYFPVTREALADNVASLKAEHSVDLRTQPVVLEVMRGRQVVQNDCRSAFDDPKFHELLERYGGLAAQIVTPVMVGGELRAILSLHQLAAARRWTSGEALACREAARTLGDRMAGSR